MCLIYGPGGIVTFKFHKTRLVHALINSSNAFGADRPKWRGGGFIDLSCANFDDNLSFRNSGFSSRLINPAIDTRSVRHSGLALNKHVGCQSAESWSWEWLTFVVGGEKPARISVGFGAAARDFGMHFWADRRSRCCLVTTGCPQRFSREGSPLYWAQVADVGARAVFRPHLHVCCGCGAHINALPLQGSFLLIEMFLIAFFQLLIYLSFSFQPCSQSIEVQSTPSSCKINQKIVTLRPGFSHFQILFDDLIRFDVTHITPPLKSKTFLASLLNSQRK